MRYKRGIHKEIGEDQFFEKECDHLNENRHGTDMIQPKAPNQPPIRGEEYYFCDKKNKKIYNCYDEDSFPKKERCKLFEKT